MEVDGAGAGECVDAGEMSRWNAIGDTGRWNVTQFLKDFDRAFVIKRDILNMRITELTDPQ